MNINTIRRPLYRVGSILGWVNAASRGPAALLARFVRVYALKVVYRVLGRLL